MLKPLNTELSWQLVKHMKVNLISGILSSVSHSVGSWILTPSMKKDQLFILLHSLSFSNDTRRLIYH